MDNTNDINRPEQNQQDDSNRPQGAEEKQTPSATNQSDPTPVEKDEPRNTTPRVYNFGVDYGADQNGDPVETPNYYYDYTRKNGKKKRKTSSIFPAIALIVSLTALMIAVVLVVFSMTNGGQILPPITDSGSPTTDSTETGNRPDTPDTIVYNDGSNWINDGSVTSDDAIVQATYNSVDSVVAITVSLSSSLGSSQGAGSGVIIAEEHDKEGGAVASYVITNYHVIDGASTIKVTLTNGDTIDAALVGGDPQTDIAVVKVKAVGLRLAKLGDSSKLLLGETVLAIGNPLGEFANTVTDGILSGLERDITIEGVSMKLLQTNAAINPGNSGGGLFNLNSELIGIVNAKSSGTAVEGLGFAIPINTAKEIAFDIIENGYVSGRCQIGVSGWEVTSDNYSSYREDEIYQYIYDYNKANKGLLQGFYVTDDSGVIYSDKNGEKFEYGDVIAAIGGIKVGTGSSISSALLNHEIGKSVTITVYRLVETETTMFGQTYKTTQIKSFDVDVILSERKS